MQHLYLTRRLAILGAAATLGGCSALSSLNDAATPIDTYDLAPAPATSSGGGSGRTMLVARPDAPAGIATDRIMVRSGPAAITYLPDARWADDLPAVVQSLLVRSIAGTGRMGYVGPSEGGPVPDLALLARVDHFEVDVAGEAAQVRIAISLTMLRDRDQSVLRTRAFFGRAIAASDLPADVIAAFQSVLDRMLPEMAAWATRG